MHIRGLGPANEEIEQSSELDSSIQLVQKQDNDNRSSRAPEALAYLEELKDYHQRFLKNRSKRSAIQDVPYSDVKELLDLALVRAGLSCRTLLGVMCLDSHQRTVRLSFSTDNFPSWSHEQTIRRRLHPLMLLP